MATLAMAAPAIRVANTRRRAKIASPWETRPHNLVSWWDMEKFAAEEFFKIATQLSSLAHYAQQDLERGIKSPIISASSKGFMAAVTEIEGHCEKLGLKVSVQAARGALRLLASPDTVFSDLAPAIQQLRNDIQWETQSVLFFHVPGKQSDFYDQKELFGVDVNLKFPSIQYDMVEAGNCYAMGRGTACVFHLMRIMEVGVQGLGTKLGVTLVAEKNWQNILDEVNKAIKRLPPKDSATIAKSQASASLYSVKLAWRNEVMHPNDTYTLEEAENLIRQVKTFMGYLVTII
jgi:hypothetical protein